MRDESDTENRAAGRWPGRLTAAWETVAMLLLFAAAGAWPVPDVNETVYLTKARHHVDPRWAAGDWFLETPDAHGAFYLLFGPLAAALPLEQAAWVGRWLGWLALAVGFRAAVAPLVATTAARILAAAIFSLAVRSTTMAGEWLIGGCEAKVFSSGAASRGAGGMVSRGLPPGRAARRRRDRAAPAGRRLGGDRHRRRLDRTPARPDARRRHGRRGRCCRRRFRTSPPAALAPGGGRHRACSLGHRARGRAHGGSRRRGQGTGRPDLRRRPPVAPPAAAHVRGAARLPASPRGDRLAAARSPFRQRPPGCGAGG